jgi:hypothetical protein
MQTAPRRQIWVKSAQNWLEDLQDEFFAVLRTMDDMSAVFTYMVLLLVWGCGVATLIYFDGKTQQAGYISILQMPEVWALLFVVFLDAVQTLGMLTIKATVGKVFFLITTLPNVWIVALYIDTVIPQLQQTTFERIIAAVLIATLPQYVIVTAMVGLQILHPAASAAFGKMFETGKKTGSYARAGRSRAVQDPYANRHDLDNVFERFKRP